MGKTKANSTQVYEVEKAITAAQAQEALKAAAQKNAAECQVGIDALLLKHDCYQFVVHIHKPGQSFYRIITEARIRT